MWTTLLGTPPTLPHSTTATHAGARLTCPQTTKQTKMVSSLEKPCAMVTNPSNSDRTANTSHNNRTFSLPGCTIEKNVDYLWNDVNNGLEDKQPDVISCRSFCKSMSAKFFSWTGPDYPIAGDRNGCWCKTALEMDNKMTVAGVFSGATVCDEDNNGE